MNHLGLVLVLFLLSVQVWSQPTILPHIKNADLEQAVTERFNTSFFNLPSHAEKIILNNIFSQGHVLTTFYSNESVEEELGWRQNSMEDIQDKKIGIRPVIYFAVNPELSRMLRSDLHNLVPDFTSVNSLSETFYYRELQNESAQVLYANASPTYAALRPENGMRLKRKNGGVHWIEKDPTSGYFEPDETRKGDVARIAFYTRLMYSDHLGHMATREFDDMMEDLCHWHQLDPVDEEEMTRTLHIAKFQDDKANPFVLDCTLANRLYCPQNPAECTNCTSYNQDEFRLDPPFAPEISVSPISGKRFIKIDIANTPPGPYRLDIYNKKDELVLRIEEHIDYFHTIQLLKGKLGRYTIHLTNLENGKRISDSFQVEG